MSKCVFFDRDGVVNRSPGPECYVERLQDFEVLPEFINVLKLVLQAGYSAVVVTNQRCVSRGIVTIEEVDRMHEHLRSMLLDKHGLELLGVYVCPHGRDDGCSCRKPRPGMLLEAAESFGLDLSECWMIGDHETDIEAGAAAGCRTIRILDGDTETDADFSVALMSDLPGRIMDFIETGKEEDDR